MRSPDLLHSRIQRRARGHAAACQVVLGSAADIDHSAAVFRHTRFVGEVISELIGRKHRVMDGYPLREATPDAPGRLYVSVHRGNWIVGARALGDPGDPLHTVAGIQLHRRINRWLVNWLGSQGVVVHPPEGSHRVLHRVLAAGGRVFLHLDGNPFGPGETGWRPRRVPPGVRSAALLASRCGPRVSGVLCERRAGRDFIVRQADLTPGDDASGRPTGTRSSVGDWERRLLDHLRAMVREDPEDWILFRDDHLGGGN